MIVIVPMAGKGSRLAGYANTPKPLIPILGRPMIAWALEGLKRLQYSRIIFVALREHEEKYRVTEIVKELVGENAEVVLLDDFTDGQLCTVLEARNGIFSGEDLLICSADTYVVSNLVTDINRMPQDCHGLISTANLPGNHWSFARTDDAGNVIEVAEKIRISSHASTGLYYFKSGQEFLNTADEVIAKKEKTRGEYYVIPVYQKFIQRGLKVRISHAKEVWDMGTPDAIGNFKKWLKENK